MMSPTAENVVGSATLVMARCGFWSIAVTVASAVTVRAVLPKSAVPVEVFLNEPAVMSAAVMAWVAVQVILSPAARVAGTVPQARSLTSGSATAGVVRVTSPSLVRTMV